jgi:hypothetical protein
MSKRVVLVSVAVWAALIPAGASGGPPRGATAQCRDGTYSYSQHHSGTCSHHGGVKVWLDGSGASAASSGGNAGVAGAGSVDVGTTGLLGARTRTAGCTLGPDPDPRCSPGAYYSRLTRSVLCSPSFRTSTIRNVPDSEKHQVEIEYGLAPRGYGRALEIDHIVSLELGGSNDIANLFPEKANAHPGYHVKDALENRLHAMVCAGQIGLRAAQRQIAADWQALYVKVFGEPPDG